VPLPPIRGHAGAPGPFAALSLTDTGSGISSDQIGRIFEPFFTTKQVGHGTGMGLAVSRGMAEAQGATLELLPADVGASFRLRIPLLHPVLRASRAAPAESAPAPIGRALIVDDELDVGELVRDSLDGLFAAIDVRSSGAEALAAIAADRYDLVISDVRMPGMSGQTLRDEAVRIQPGLAQRFLFISGDVLQRDALRATLGDTPVLEKPFDPDELRELVRDFLRSRLAAA
jgi:CheY-like chemotaxis protein